jgi:hypothetical protein
MAENVNALILPIGADATQFKRSIEEVKDAIQKLSKKISSTKFNLVTPEQKAELADLKRTFSELQTDVINTGNAFAKGVAPTKNARTALTSLSLVAQDLPFGFIAIQNNLPAVISSFGALSTASKGLSGTLIALKTALIGPAGLFLAFSVITGAVTFAVQKYGSLGAAVDALFGKVDALGNVNKRAAKSLEEFNKENKSVGEAIANANSSVESQIIKLEALSQTVLNNAASENARKKALEELKSLDNERFKNFDIEKGKLDGLTNAVQDYTNAVLSRAIADKLADRASEAFVNRELQRNIYGERLKQLDQLKKRVPDIEKQVANFNKELLLSRELQKGKIGPALPRANEDVKDYLNLNQQLRESENNLIKINDQYSEARKIAKDATLESLAFGGSLKKIGNTEIKLKALSIDSQELDAAFNLESIISSIDKYGNVLLDTNKSVEERKNALKELIAINPEVFSGLTLEKSGLLANKNILEQNIRSLQVLIKAKKDDARASEINAQFRNEDLKKQDEQAKASFDKIKAYEDQFESIVKLTYAQDEYGNSTDKITAKSLAFLKVLKQQQDISAAINKGLNNIYGLGTAEENDPVKRVEDLSKRIKQAKDNFENTIRNGLQQPFEDFFSTLIETGKFSLDSFEGLFKDMLKRIAAQIISAGIAKLISSILFPPGAAAGALAGAAAGNSGGGGIIGALVSLFGGRRSAFNNVNFGGVEGGGMQMAGAVNLTLRGSDLVGSINRTNSTINRVG